MDNAKLIEMVFDRKQLWDVRDGNYHNRDHSRNLWLEIASEMRCTSHVAKSKWQNLRDTYRKEYVKLLRGGDKKGSSWKHFHELRFLDDVIALRKKPTFSPGKLSDADGRDGDVDFTDITPLRYLCCVPQTLDEEEVDTRSTVDGERQRWTPTANGTDGGTANLPPAVGDGDDAESVGWRTEREQGPGRGQRDDGIDEDYHFAMSLLPHLRDVPRRRKLQVRQKLLRVLMDERRRTSADRCARRHDSAIQGEGGRHNDDDDDDKEETCRVKSAKRSHLIKTETVDEREYNVR